MTDIKIKRENAGLFAFYAGLVLALVIGFVIQSISKDRVRAYVTARYIDLINEVAENKKNDDIFAVVIGNSRLRNAMEYGAVAKPQILADGRRVWWLRFAEDAAAFRSYESIWPRILQAKPDFLFVMPQLLTTNDFNSFLSVRKLPRYLYLFFENLIKNTTPEDMWSEIHLDKITDCFPANTEEALQESINFVAHRDRHSLEYTENRSAALKAMREARNAGVKIVMLEVTMNEAAMKELETPAHVMDYHGLGRTPSKKEVFPVLHDEVTQVTLPSQPQGHYCDFTHLNEKGGRASYQWFTETIADLIEDQSGP